MNALRIIFCFICLIWGSSCATTEAERRVDELSKRAHKDLYCDQENVTVALISPRVIGATGCGRTRYYSILHPFN